MNMKMKTLSLAVLGLAGLAFAGSASADCVAGNLSAWSSTSALLGTITVATGGLETSPQSECRLDTSLSNNPGSTAFVRDNTPAAEARYRAQFLIDTTPTGALTGLESVKIYGAATDTAANGRTELVKLTIFGDAITPGVKLLGISAACGTAPTFLCASNTPLAAGVNRIEIDWNKSANSLKVWVNSTVEGTVTKTLPLVNLSAWTGIDYTTLGLAVASPAFLTGHANQVIKFDRFDSRRQTFIGN